MAYSDDSDEAQVRGWRAIALLHARVEHAAESALRRDSGLSAVEFTVLDVLARQKGRQHLRMRQVARATALSESATTRLVDRLEERGLLSRYLCADDRRGIYAELTASGREALLAARPIHDAAVRRTLVEIAGEPGMTAVVAALAPLLTGAGDAAGEDVPAVDVGSPIVQDH